MSPRAAAWLAWSLCAFSLALTALSLLLLALNLSHPDAYVYEFWDGDTLVALSFSIIGAIIASRLPANPLGWLFCAAACMAAVDHFSAEYAIYYYSCRSCQKCASALVVATSGHGLMVTTPHRPGKALLPIAEVAGPKPIDTRACALL